MLARQEVIERLPHLVPDLGRGRHEVGVDDVQPGPEIVGIVNERPPTLGEPVPVDLMVVGRPKDQEPLDSGPAFPPEAASTYQSTISPRPSMSKSPS